MREWRFWLLMILFGLCVYGLIFQVPWTEKEHRTIVVEDRYSFSISSGDDDMTVVTNERAYQHVTAVHYDDRTLTIEQEINPNVRYMAVLLAVFSAAFGFMAFCIADDRW